MVLRILFLMLMMFGSVQAHADIRRIAETAVTTDTLGAIASTIVVPTTTTVITKSFSLVDVPLGNIGVAYKATSSGVINLKLEALQGPVRPASEITDDGTFPVWEVLDTAIIDNKWHVQTLDTLVMPYGRFRITGQGSNDATTTIQIKVGKN